MPSKADNCDKCGAVLNLAGVYVLKALDGAFGPDPKREYAATVICQECGTENKRRLDFNQDSELHRNQA